MDSSEQWRAYLASYSADFFRVADEDRLRAVGPERRASGWLGFDGASPAALAALEARLGTALPPSYRAFLEASDGWLEIGPFVWTMRTTADVGWMRDVHPGLCDAGFSDDALMTRALLVSADSDVTYWLLDPADVGPGGEWAAYVWASWYPGFGDRFDSFAALVADERASFERLNAREGRPVAPSGAAELVAEGRRLALLGDAGGAAERFEAAADKGSGAGLYLAVVLAAFREPDGVQYLIRNDVLGRPHVVAAVGAPRIRSELLPLLLCRQSGAGVDRLIGQALGDSAPADLPAGPAEFVAAIERARDLARRGDGDAAWETVAAAVPAWHSDDPLSIAPVALLSDPVLAPLVTASRAAWILTTPKAGGGSGVRP